MIPTGRPLSGCNEGLQDTNRQCADVTLLLLAPVSHLVACRAQAGVEAQCASWDASWRALLAELHTMEAAVQADLQQRFAALQAECQSYGGFGEDELAQQLQQGAVPAMDARQSAANDLLQKAAAFLEHQAAHWQAAAGKLAAFWFNTAQTVASNEAACKAADKAKRRQITGMQAEHEREQQALEAALAVTLDAVKKAHSEADLDEKVAAALSHLGCIESAFRAAASALTDTASAYPAEVQHQHNAHSLHLSAKFCLEDAGPTGEAGSSTTTAAVIDSAAPGQAAGHVDAPPGSTGLVVLAGRAWRKTRDLLDAILHPVPASPEALTAELRPETAESAGSQASAGSGKGKGPAKDKDAGKGRPGSKQQARPAAAAVAAPEPAVPEAADEAAPPTKPATPEV